MSSIIFIKFKDSEKSYKYNKKLISMLFITIKNLIDDLDTNQICIKEIVKKDFDNILRECIETITIKNHNFPNEFVKIGHYLGCIISEYKLTYENICFIVARDGLLELLKYVHKIGCYWNKYTCEYVALNGQLECFKYAHENGRSKADVNICFGSNLKVVL
jgi:hypothetical protein